MTKNYIFSILSMILQGANSQEYPDPIRVDKLLDGTHKTWEVTFQIPHVGDLSTPIRGEDELKWDYFISIQDRGVGQNLWGYDSAANRQFGSSSSSNSVVYKFLVVYDANNFKDSGSKTTLEDALAKDALNDGLGFGLNLQYLESATVTFIESSNCDQKVSDQTICESLNFPSAQCIELETGAVECISSCSILYKDQTCGANGACNQLETTDVNGSFAGYSEPECECSSSNWWNEGDPSKPENFGNSADPCKPVLKNWLIIVIGVVGFLFLVLIIIAIVYCCVHGCRCPACCKCKRSEDETYVVKNGKSNLSFMGDNSSSKAPLYSQYGLPEPTTMVQNPSVWKTYEDLGRNGTFRTEASGHMYDSVTIPRNAQPAVDDREYTTYDRRPKHRDESTTDRRKRRGEKERKKSRHASNQSKTKIDTLEAEIKKLETDIEVMKSVHDINDSRTGYNEPDNASLVSSIQAPQPEQTAIEALDLSDVEVDPPMRKYESRTVLVETPQMTNPGMKSLNDTLKDRWRVPPLTVMPVDNNPTVRQIDSSII